MELLYVLAAADDSDGFDLDQQLLFLCLVLIHLVLLAVLLLLRIFSFLVSVDQKGISPLQFSYIIRDQPGFLSASFPFGPTYAHPR